MLLSTIVIMLLSALLFGWIVMLLWNWLMPVIFKLPEINWLQACGLNILCGLIFSRINFNSK